jgi:hypothetical protein
MASKWIGLSEYEQAMKELQKQSEVWGDVALVLGIVTFVLILPTWPARSKSKATHGILTAPGNIWTEYFGQCIFRTGIILFGDIWPCRRDSFRRKFPAQISQCGVSSGSCPVPKSAVTPFTRTGDSEFLTVSYPSKRAPIL